MAIRVTDFAGKTLKAAGRGALGAPGKNGIDGKSAYQYAVDGGYTGTEAEFRALLSSGPWLPLAGGVMTGKITGIVTPEADGDAVNKGYIDSVLQSQAKIKYGTYTGTGDDAGARIVFPFQTKVFFAISHMTTSDYVGFAIKNNATTGTSGIVFHYDSETTSGKVNTTLYDMAFDSGGIRVVAKGGFNVRNRTYSYLGIGLGEEEDAQ